MVVAVLVLLFVVLPITELYLFVQAVQAFGFLWALAALVGTTLIGAWLVKRAGIRVWSRFTDQVRHKAVPAKEVVDGALLLLAGALFLFPGFLTDAIALFFLFPPTRALIRTIVLKVTRVEPIVATYDRVVPNPPRPGTSAGGVIDVTSTTDDATGADGADDGGRPHG